MDFFKRMKKNMLKSPMMDESLYPDQHETLFLSLQENVSRLKVILGDSQDLVTREIRFGLREKLQAAILYIDGLVDKKSLQDFIISTMMLDIKGTELERNISSKKDPLDILKESILAVGDIKETDRFRDLVQFLLSGNVIILMDKAKNCLSIAMQEWEKRSISEPSTQTVIRGPKEGFSENLSTSISLIRRKIKDSRLRMEKKQMGELTKTDVAIMYIKGVTDENIIKEVNKRLDQIDLFGLLEGGMIEETIQDEKYTPFPTMYNTERPDVVAAGLLEGRVAILVDGTPFVLLVPAIFSQFYQAAEDYYQRPDFGTLVRILRYIGLFIALLGPSFYIAIITFHQEMIPHPLMISLAAQREGVPFPTFVEATLLLMMFEIMREAGVRMPRAVGQAISIVGAIVIGQAAVNAGIVSAAVVIVIAGTAISSFVLPSNNMEIAVRILRFILMCLSAFLGFFGLIMGLIAIVIHLCSLHSFGVPYMSPFAPFVLSAQKDTIIRSPLSKPSEGNKT